MSPKSELLQQQADLVAALFSPTLVADLPKGLRSVRGGSAESTALPLQGLKAYRANGLALAHRALCAAYPTVLAMLGDEAMRALARDLWWQHPPVRGDVAHWGGELAEWLGQRAELREWPWLADCARLDWAMHQADMADEGPELTQGLHRLGEHPPEALGMRWAPGTALIVSPWPLAALWQAHRQAPADEVAMAAALARVESDQVQGHWVWRQAWQTQVVTLAPGGLPFMRCLSQGGNLADALTAAAPFDFDFQSWLILALRSSWIADITFFGIDS